MSNDTRMKVTTKSTGKDEYLTPVQFRNDPRFAHLDDENAENLQIGLALVDYAEISAPDSSETWALQIVDAESHEPVDPLS